MDDLTGDDLLAEAIADVALDMLTRLDGQPAENSLPASCGWSSSMAVRRPTNC